MREENIITQTGLSEEQAIVYQSLLEKGPQKASDLATWAGIKRPTTYKILEELVNMGIVSKKESQGSVATFWPNHPQILLERIDQKQKELETTKELISYSLGSLVSKYNLINEKPNIQFYEGLHGVKKVLDDTLDSKGEILTYVDMEIVEKYFKDINDKYVVKREKLGIQKRLLVIENTYSNTLFQKWNKEKPDFFSVTNLKMVKTPLEGVEGAIQIYENKIGIITISNENLISIIIEDIRINKLFKSMFEALYLASPRFTP